MKGKSNGGLSSESHMSGDWKGRKDKDAHMIIMRCADGSYAPTIGGIDFVFHSIKFVSDHRRT